MKAYSKDLRERIVKSVLEGQNIDEVAARYEVSTRTIWRYMKLYREQGELRAKKHPGPALRMSVEQQEMLRQKLQDYPSLTLTERVAMLY